MVLRLFNANQIKLPDELIEEINRYKYAFNPSFTIFEKINYLAIRLFNKESNSIIATVFCWDDDLIIKKINLSDYFKHKLGLEKVADPKLFIMNGKVWGTFNTGYQEFKQNEIVLFNFNNKLIDEFYLCDYNGRERVEKNWAFYTREHQLFCLYSTSPLVVLKLDYIDSNRMNFQLHFESNHNEFKNYSIGTQLAKVGDSYYFIGHKKILIAGKRIYFGRFFKFDFKEEIPIINSDGHFLFHSFLSLLGVNFKFNKNLISCTYFSGFHIEKSKVIISYGVNDVDWKVITFKKSKLCN